MKESVKQWIEKYSGLIMGICVVIAALTFWDLRCTTLWAIAVANNDPSPQDFLNINPFHHLRKLL